MNEMRCHKLYEMKPFGKYDKYYDDWMSSNCNICNDDTDCLARKHLIKAYLEDTTITEWVMDFVGYNKIFQTEFELNDFCKKFCIRKLYKYKNRIDKK